MMADANLIFASPLRDKSLRKEVNMKYICDICGWVYDEELGDLELGIEPGTKFEDLPEDFLCPLCMVGKDMFSEVEE